MLEKVEKYWHEQNFKNRNEAIRDLVEKGLKKDDE
jgi:metal-responsive CopG/Arc/MetJ family transcriptional regulator